MSELADTLKTIRRRVSDRLYGSEAWGSKDLERLQRIEDVIGRQLPPVIRTLASTYGNLLLPPFEIILLGADGGPVGALALTEDVRAQWRDLSQDCLVIGSAGGHLMVLMADNAVGLFDQDYNPARPAEISIFQNSVDLLEYVLQESEAIQRDPMGF